MAENDNDNGDDNGECLDGKARDAIRWLGENGVDFGNLDDGVEEEQRIENARKE